MTNNNIAFDKIVEEFADVHFHVEEKKTFTIIKANKVILALHSKYLHRLFQSVGKSETVHLHYKGVPKLIIEYALKVMYGEILKIEENDLNRLVAFLKLLEVEFETTNWQEDQESPGKKRPKISHDLVAEQVKKKHENITAAEISPLMGTTSPATNIYDDSNRDHQGSSSSSRPIRITNRKGESVSLDNWTTTTFEDREKELDDIDFKFKENENKRQHDFYVCRHCEFVAKEFTTAKEHFMMVHQNSEVEREIMKEVFDHKKKAFNEINSLQIAIRNDKVNKKMAICSLQTIVDNLQDKVETLKGLKMKNMTPNLLIKREEFIKSMEEAITKVSRYIDKSGF